MTHYRTFPQMAFPVHELVIDNFAGGGGASTGIEHAIGRPVDIAINHDRDAIAMHMVNHPATKHLCEDVFEVDPREVCNGMPVGLAWFSPDCKHFSKAKGGTPVNKQIRGLAWVAVRWAATVSPRIIVLENVEEFTTWGPVVAGKPCPKRKGRTFENFVGRLRQLGYQVEWQMLRACDYGAPTIRKRLFLVARRDGMPIVWPQPSHGDPSKPGFKKSGLKKWKTAADIIDWSLPCPSIFERKRPLAENTQRRIARGIERFVINNPKPFIVRIGQQGFGGDSMQYSADAPLTTITTKAEHLLVNPILVGCGGRAGQSRPRSADEPAATITGKADVCLVAPIISRQFGKSVGHGVDEPSATITAGGGGKSQLVAAFLAKHFGGNYTGAGADMGDPLPTVTAVDHNALVTSHMIKLRGENTGSKTDEPLHTVSAQGTHHGEVRAFLIKFYSEGGQWQSVTDPLHTIPTKDRLGLVTVNGEPYQIVDIGMRMLEPHELFAAQGFPSDYVINVDASGKPTPKYKQVARCGNSVSPPIAAAIVAANFATAPAQQEKQTA